MGERKCVFLVKKKLKREEEIQVFQLFQKFADGGLRRKTEKFWQIEKKNR